VCQILTLTQRVQRRPRLFGLLDAADDRTRPAERGCSNEPRHLGPEPGVKDQRNVALFVDRRHRLVDRQSPIMPSVMETADGVCDTRHGYRIVRPGRQERWPGVTIPKGTSLAVTHDLNGTALQVLAIDGAGTEHPGAI
jgi:hypothetical protein